MSNKARGFTLIEVLVAFTILAVSVGTLLVAFSGGLRSSSLTRDYTQAVIIAESRLAETGTVQESSYKQEGVDGKFGWKKIIEPLDRETEGIWQLYQVTVLVNWENFNGKRSLEIGSLRWGRVDD